jgi:ribosomal protein S18 acetylase RimI-like enzyme/ubiquinone/menaquinone biosynthesis C-methylase UbiE
MEVTALSETTGPTQTSYDRVAGEYARRVVGELEHKPLDRALLAVLAEIAPPGPIADLGCGPGHVARHLHDLGREVIAIDLSPAMVETARRLCPGPEYRVGNMLALDLADGSLGGAVASYSIIHLGVGELAIAFSELHRVLGPDAPALLAFHTGRHVLHMDEWWGSPVSLDFHFHVPDTVRRLLEGAGLSVEWDLRRQPGPGEVQTERAYLLARRPAITLRPAADADREFLRNLHHVCYRPWVEPIWGWDEADQDRRFAAAFSTEGRSIVEQEGRPIGTIRIAQRQDAVVIADIAVLPEHQGRGIGSRLLRGVLAEADRHSRPVRLQVLRTNPARRLYERQGFGVEAETPERYLMVRPT